MNDDVATLLKHQLEMLGQIAQLLEDTKEQSARHHAELLRRSDEVEGWLSMINSNADS